jgi:hypothetical protein
MQICQLLVEKASQALQFVRIAEIFRCDRLFILPALDLISE